VVILDDMGLSKLSAKVNYSFKMWFKFVKMNMQSSSTLAVLKLLYRQITESYDCIGMSDSFALCSLRE